LYHYCIINTYSLKGFSPKIILKSFKIIVEL
jgi:hypothetical protein